MKITKRQLRRIIKEQHTELLKEGNHAVEYAIGYEDARDNLPQNSDDPWYAAGYADFLDGVHDQYSALHQDGITTPPATPEPSQHPRPSLRNESKLTKRRLKQIIKEEYGKLFNTEAAWLLEYEQYVDEDGNVYDDEGNVSRRGKAFGRRYGGGTYGTRGLPSAGRSSRRSSRRKTSYVGQSANSDKIAAIEAALNVKPSNFLDSVLEQLKNGRGLSSKQISIVAKILKKAYPAGLIHFQ